MDYTTLMNSASVASFLTRARVDELLRQAAKDGAETLTTIFAMAVRAIGQYVSAMHDVSARNSEHLQGDKAQEIMFVTLDASNRSLHAEPASLLKLQVCP